MISKEQVEYMASLAKLKIEDDKLDRFTQNISDVLKYLEILDKVDTEDVEPLYQVYDYNQVFREDLVEEGLTREQVLQNTVEKQYGYFKLLNIMD